MNPQLVTVRLYGHLGKKFGRVHHYAIATPAEAIRAMRATLPGFKAYLVEHAKSGFRILAGQEDLGPSRLGELTGSAEIRIIPVVAGGKDGLTMIVLGAVMIAAATWTGGASLSYMSAVWGSTTASMVAGIGASMLIGGISQLLSSPPDPGAYGADETGPKSYLFNGADQQTQAGGCVPVLCGELEISPIPVSGSIVPEAPGLSHFGLLGDGTGAWTGDGLTVPLAASYKGA
jgi:predicted phage tail protein